MISRRSLITGLISLAAAPAIVRIESLMPVKVMEPIVGVDWASDPDMTALWIVESNPVSFNHWQRMWFNSQLGKFVTEPISYEDFYK